MGLNPKGLNNRGGWGINWLASRLGTIKLMCTRGVRPSKDLQVTFLRSLKKCQH
ncbi:hypothetical protein DPMN_171095 [Dreissena polymorpha]|uniref:Uncharacterized protein n=1 Tax=Dreissena polymorpha TaxID=45954 RepID=A0A9D4IF90_DREPO|nr:hypothetical protein DPMN_171095 [Dreissena polymorpha]